MKRNFSSIVRHIPALGLVVLAGPLHAAPKPNKEKPTPAPVVVEQADASKEQGWMSRITTAPKKLAFWNKEGKEQAAEAEAEVLPATKPAAKRDESPVKRGKKASTGGNPKPAPVQEQVVPETPEKKMGFLSRIPVPFLKKESVEEAEEMVPPPTPAEKKRDVSKKIASEEIVPMGEPEVDRDRFAFITRFWGGDKGDEPAPVAQIAPPPGKKMGPEKPGAKPDAQELNVPPDPAAENTDKKWAFWSRMTSSVIPGLAERPKTTPIARGVLPGGAAELTSATFVITKDDSPFYSFGPNQTTPPDAYLATGTVVTLTERSWGWAEVQLGDGRSGMVARDALRQATAFDLVPETAPSMASALLASVEPPKIKKTPVPSFVLPDMDLPDLPEPDPELVGPLPPGEVATDIEALSASLLPPFEE